MSVLTLLCLIVGKSEAQQATITESRNLKNETSDTKADKNIRVVSNETFNKIVKKDLEFIILGEESPLAGFSLDVSDKTKAKIVGKVPAKTGIRTIELEAGQKDNDIPLFEGGKYAGQLELKYNHHYIPFASRYSYVKKANAVADSLFKLKKIELNDRMLDSLEVVAYLLKSKDSDMYTVATALSLEKIKEADDLTASQYGIQRRARPIIDNPAFPRDTTLFRSISRKYFPTIPTYPIPSTEEIRDTVQKTTSYKADLLYKDLRHLLSRLVKRNQLNVEAEMAIVSPFWLNKHFRWLTFSPSVNYQAYNIYGIDKDGKMLPPKTTMPFVKGKLAIWASRYDVYKKAGYLWRLGSEFVYGHYLMDFKEVKYYVRDTLQAEGNGNTVVEESVTSGLYRLKDSRRKEKLYLNFHGEFYILPRKTFMPGFNVKMSALRDELLPTNPYRLRIQGGLVFNLLNKEKDKPVLSILPYVRYANLLGQEVKEGDQVRLMTSKEKLSIGITIGLPIKGLSFEKED